MFGAFAARAARPLVVAGDTMNEPVTAAAPKKEPSCKGDNATVEDCIDATSVYNHGPNDRSMRSRPSAGSDRHPACMRR